MIQTEQEIKDFANQSSEKLWNDGITIFNFPSVFGDDAWKLVQDAYSAFQRSEKFQSQQREFVNNPPSIEVDNLEKRFLFRLLNTLGSDEKINYDAGDPWMQIATNPILLESARAYFLGGQPVLDYHDVWYTMPFSELGSERPRVASQNWHVDGEAQGVPGRIFKAFLYFNDIDEGSGPLEIYVSGASNIGNRHIKVCVPAGTMIFVDTGRFLHRGGYCLERPRMLSLWYYTNGTGFNIPPLIATPRFTAPDDVMQKLGRGKTEKPQSGVFS